MFEKLVKWIKGVVNKMLGKESVEEALDINLAISSDMVNAITLWENVYRNKAPWLKKDEIVSLELGSSISNEFARLTTLEMTSEITGSERAKFLNEIYKKLLENLNDNLEIGNAVGGLIFKPYVVGKTLKIDYVKASDFLPVEYDDSKNIIAGIFTSQIAKGEYIYTRLEYHKFIANEPNNDNYYIRNIAYKSKDFNNLGDRISLKEVEEWSSIEEITVIKFVDRPLFSYYKPPIANNIDIESPIGMSVFSRAIDLIKEADTQFGRILWEYEASEKAVFVDELAIKTKIKNVFDIAKLKDRLFKKLDTGKDDFFKDYSPEIRDEELWRGLNKILQRIEFVVGLAYGTLSEPNTVDKTATEIKSSKQRSYATVSRMQENLQKALENLVYSMNVMADLYKLTPKSENYEVSFNWDDSLVVDAEKEQTLQMQEVNQGLRSKVKYIMYRYGLTEEQAKEELEIIQQEKISNQEAFGFINNDDNKDEE